MFSSQETELTLEKSTEEPLWSISKMTLAYALENKLRESPGLYLGIYSEALTVSGHQEGCVSSVRGDEKF